MGEGALAEREDLGRCHGEHERCADFVVEAALTGLELPASIPLRPPRVGEPLQRCVVGNLDGLALGVKRQKSLSG